MTDLSTRPWIARLLRQHSRIVRLALIALIAASAALASGQVAPATPVESQDPGASNPSAEAAQAGDLETQPEPDPIASYRIEVRLDPETDLLHGSQTLTWVNDSEVPVGDMWFHLYQNAFMNESSTKAREWRGFPQARGSMAERIGYTDVETILLDDGTDLLSSMRWRHPDDDNAEDRTVFSVDLPAPVPPGGKIDVHMEFTTKLPRHMERSGVWGEYFIATQWFPKVGVFEEIGEGGATVAGWNAHQFHANTEFFADFGDYEVQITAPERFVVGASGRRVESLDRGDGTITHTFRQETIHDFAWTAYPGFVEIVRTFNPDDEITRGEIEEVARLLDLDYENLELQPVEVTLLAPPAFAHNAERHIRATMDGLKWYGLWYGAYPYDNVTVLVPADGTTGGGMEYPTFFTSTDVYPMRFWPLSGIRLQEMVSVHEFGHQFWYGLVASNEMEEAWLDEGLNSYSTSKTMERAYGTGMGNLLGINLDPDAFARGSYIADARTGTMVQNAWEYIQGYSSNSYTRPELALRTLERHLGEPTFARAMREYQQRWRYRHPTSRDFFDVVEEVCACDLSLFWDQMVLGDRVADFAVVSASSRQAEPPRGRFWRDGEWVIVEGGISEDETPEEGAGEVERVEAEAAPPVYETRVVVQRLEDFIWPVDVLLHFEDGSEHLEVWDGRDRLHAIELEGPSRLEWAAVDPSNKLPLDINQLNNSRVISEDPDPRWRWTRRWLFWMANLLFAASGSL